MTVNLLRVSMPTLLYHVQSFNSQVVIVIARTCIAALRRRRHTVMRGMHEYMYVYVRVCLL